MSKAKVVEPTPGYKEICIRKHEDPSKALEVIIPDYWTVVEIMAIPAAIRRQRRQQLNQMRKEGTDNE